MKPSRVGWVSLEPNVLHPLSNFILDEEAFCIIKLVHDDPIMKTE